MNGTAIKGLGRGAGRAWGTEAAVMGAAALLMAGLGPFGTWALPWPVRLGDWLLFAIAGYLCFRPVVAAADVLARHTALPRPAALGLACLVAAVPTTLPVAWAVGGMALADLTVGTLAALYPEVALVGLLVTAVQVAIAGRRPRAGPEAVATLAGPTPAPELPAEPAGAPPAATAPGGSPPSAPASSFLDRLPPALGRDLLALEQEDHYLRVHTALGSTLLLMRMRDAVAELAATDGARVHRSWWVARGAVAAVERRERAVALKLTNGLEVPVARASVPGLREAGWW